MHINTLRLIIAFKELNNYYLIKLNRVININKTEFRHEHTSEIRKYPLNIIFS
jgi:hypothetical protein